MQCIAIHVIKEEQLRVKHFAHHVYLHVGIKPIPLSLPALAVKHFRSTIYHLPTAWPTPPFGWLVNPKLNY